MLSSVLGSRATSGGSIFLLIASYILDWVIVVAAGGLAALFYNITPNKRPFQVTDPSISYPFSDETVTTAILALVAFAIPVLIIFFVTMLLVPGPTVPKSTPRSLIWRRKLWELQTGWLGLALSLTTTLFITYGLKNVVGKPRPDLLARCNPDISNLSSYIVGSNNLVSHKVCQNNDQDIMNDGFSSFPSGHSSFSFAGLSYLSLFLASKLAVTIPFLAPSAYGKSKVTAFPSRDKQQQVAMGQNNSSCDGQEVNRSMSGHNDAMIAARNQAAAPPLYLLAIVLAPLLTAAYVAATRWSDFRHFGFDILAGSFIGILTSVFAFRYYHLPVNQGAGWSWGPRSNTRAFWAGVGVGNYVGYGGNGSATTQDEESGTIHTRNDSIP